MKAAINKPRAKHQPGRKSHQPPPLTRLLVADAFRTWVIPTVTISIALVIFVVYNIGLVEPDVAVTSIGTLALALVLFLGLRSFTEQSIGGGLAALLAGFAVLFSLATFYPFYRALNPGEPLFTATLNRNSAPVTLPLRDKPGHYSLMVLGHFPPEQGKQNRTATYRLAVGHDGSADQILEGTFHQEWRSQRIGAGRRSSLIPVMTQTTQVLSALDDFDGREITLKLADLSPGVGDSLMVKLFPEGVPKSVLIVLGVLTVAGAVLIDAYRPGNASEGLMGTLALATFVSIVIFRGSSSATPGFPQFIIAALVGTVAGAIGGSLLWRLTRMLKLRLHRSTA